MKKLMIFGVAVLALTSCKKDFQCECVSTSYLNDSIEGVYESTTTIEGVSKRTVSNEFNCVSSESSYVDSDGDVSTYKTACTVTKL